LSVTATAHADALRYLARYESNARTYARTFDRVMARGSMARLWDVTGREYLDCVVCAGALPLGHNHPFVTERVQRFLDSGHIQQALDIPTAAKVEFVRELVAVLPEGFRDTAKFQFCGPSGSDAVEAAIKLFRTATGRRSVIAFHGAYHGMTLGAMSLMGNLGPKTPAGQLAGDTHFFPFPDRLRCPLGIGGAGSAKASLAYLANALSDPSSGITKPAMVIAEVVQGEGGCNPAPVEWLRGLREVTRTHDIPLVIDEVQTGFGRTGEMFAHEIAGIEPDAIVLSKAVGGGYPMALVAYHRRYDKWLSGAHAGTFRGNQIAMVAGAATMEYIRTERLAAVARDKGDRLMRALSRLADHPCIGEIRGRGLMVGVEVVRPDHDEVRAEPLPLDGPLAQKIKEECFARGLLVETGGRHGAVIRFLPPLLIADDEIDEAAEILEQSVLARTERHSDDHPTALAHPADA
jgi:diaminobutyrate-2-oxoglutarate transaminase